MTRLYTNREGQVWTVRQCAPMPFFPGFFIGFRQDGVQVMIHEHRSTEVPEVPAKQVEAAKGGAL